MARRSLKLLLSYRLSEWLLTNRSSPYSQQVAICRPSAEFGTQPIDVQVISCIS